jgi:hypothetical protein
MGKRANLFTRTPPFEEGIAVIVDGEKTYDEGMHTTLQMAFSPLPTAMVMAELRNKQGR